MFEKSRVFTSYAGGKVELIIFAIVFNHMKLTWILVFSSVLTLMIFNWITYVGYVGVENITDYLSGLKENIWIMLFISPFILISFELQVFSLEKSILKSAYNLEALVLELLCLLASWNLMLKIMIDKDIFKRVDKKQRNINIDRVLAIGSLVTIQLLNFISVVYLINHRYPTLLSLGVDKYVTDFFDVVYFVVMTYTTVGYGDISPNLLIGKMIACAISLTGFMTSVCIIGEVVKGFCNEKL